MGLLRVAPTEQIRSLPELMAIAHAMESEAAQRYGELAAYMRRIGNPQTADVLDALAAEERGHAEMVDRLSEDLTGKTPDLADIGWSAWPEVFSDEDVGASRIATPYRMLSIAVRNEERAFAFWSYISAHAEDEAIRREAEQMAHEELTHVATLRALRRRAFHASRTDALARPASSEDFLAAAAAESAALRDFFRDLATRLAEGAHPAAPLAATVADEQAAHLAALGGAGPAEPLTDHAAAPADAAPQALIGQAIARLESAVEGYLAAAEAAGEETVVARAQALAQSAIRRLAEWREWDDTAPRD